MIGTWAVPSFAGSARDASSRLQRRYHLQPGTPNADTGLLVYLQWSARRQINRIVKVQAATSELVLDEARHGAPQDLVSFRIEVYSITADQRLSLPSLYTDTLISTPCDTFQSYQPHRPPQPASSLPTDPAPRPSTHLAIPSSSTRRQSQEWPDYISGGAPGSACL